MTHAEETARARRCVLAVSVLDDLDLHPGDDGVLLPGDPEVLVPWRHILSALGGYDPVSAVGRRRVGDTLRLARALAGGAGAARLRHAARPLALPPDHPLHPGPDWVRERLLGGALDLGPGVLGVDPHPDLAVPLPPWHGVGRLWWPQLREHAERMGELARRRLRRDRATEIRPVGGCDALTLLASRTLRTALAGADGTGLQTVAVPRRVRGWTDLRRVDPAFLASVWLLTDDTERGVDRPLLVTRDEVALPAPGGDPTAVALG